MSVHSPQIATAADTTSLQASPGSISIKPNNSQSIPKRIIGSVEGILLRVFRTLRQVGSRQLIKSKLRHNQSMLKAVSPALEKAHKLYWSSLGKTSGHWLRYYVNVSGIESEKYVPGDLYYSMIDHRLNDADQNDLYNNKNNLDRCFGAEVLPETVARKISGVFTDAAHKVCGNPYANLPPEDLILKPSFDTSAGQNVQLLRYVSGSYLLEDGSSLTAEDLEHRFGTHFIIQKVVKAHEFCSRFNPASLNTFRVYTYRSVVDEQVHVLRTVFKIGCGNSIVDNQVAGGIVCSVSSSGILSNFATHADGTKCIRHPLTGADFRGQQVPHFDKLLQMSRDIALQIPTHRTLALDVALNSNNKATLIEVNPMAAAIDIMQCDGGPLFGDFTDEIRDYCAEHPENEYKKVIRP